MLKQYNWRILMLLALLLGFFAQPATAYAEEPVKQVINCEGTGHNPCHVISGLQLDALKEDKEFGGLYVRNAGGLFKYEFAWAGNPNPAGWSAYGQDEEVVDEIHIKRNSYTSIPDLGIFWWNGILKHSAPGYLIPGEVWTPLPSNVGLKDWEEIPFRSTYSPDWNAEHLKFYDSYSWDGGQIILSWTWVPEVTEDEVILHVMSLKVGYLTPVDSLPANKEYQFEYPSDLKFNAGEKLTVLEVAMMHQKVPYRYTVTFDDLYYTWSPEVDKIMTDLGVTFEEALNTYKVTHAEEIAQATGVKYNYRSTNWRATNEWVQGFQIQRENGETVWVPEDNIFADRPCTTEEGCFSKTFTPKAGDVLYAYPYVFPKEPDDTDFRPEYSLLFVSPVPPYQNIRDEDMALLTERWNNGELYSIKTTIGEPTWDASRRDYETTLVSGSILDISARFSPPAGTPVTIYLYKNIAVTPNSKWGGTNVMAIFDESSNMWFFNTWLEKDDNFDTFTYNKASDVKCPTTRWSDNVHFKDPMTWPSDWKAFMEALNTASESDKVYVYGGIFPEGQGGLNAIYCLGQKLGLTYNAEDDSLNPHAVGISVEVDKNGEITKICFDSWNSSFLDVWTEVDPLFYKAFTEYKDDGPHTMTRAQLTKFVSEIVSAGEAK